MATQGIVIRDMTGEDIREIIEINRQIVDEERVRTYDDPYSDPENTYLGGKVGLSKVAEADGKVIGFAIGRIMTHPYFLADTGFISLIGVLPDFQRKGVASELVKAFVKSCQEKHIKNVNTLINLDDPTMISFFNCLGFRQNRVSEFSTSTEKIP
jgi:N-acetylglutamate synthase-like GNAT family acetyltransferase